MEIDDDFDFDERVEVVIASDDTEPNVIRGVISIVVSTLVVAFVLFGRDVLCYLLEPIWKLGLLAAGLSLLIVPSIAWQWGKGEVTWRDVRNEPKTCVVIVVTILFGLSSWLLTPIRNTELLCEVQGKERHVGIHSIPLTEVFTFQCKEDAIEKAKDLDKTRLEWAKDDEGRFVKYDIEIRCVERWPIFDRLNKLLGAHIGLDFRTFTLADYEGRGAAQIELSPEEPADFLH